MQKKSPWCSASSIKLLLIAFYFLHSISIYLSVYLRVQNTMYLFQCTLTLYILPLVHVLYTLYLSIYLCTSEYRIPCICSSVPSHCTYSLWFMYFTLYIYLSIYLCTSEYKTPCICSSVPSHCTYSLWFMYI